MRISVYKATYITQLLEFVLTISAGLLMLSGATLASIMVIVIMLTWNFLFLRCPRCKSPSWTRRFFKGKGGILNQYMGFSLPQKCDLCGLDFRKNNLFDRIPWMGERAER